MRPFDIPAESGSVVGSRRQLAGSACGGRHLHRIAQVMEQESVGVRTAARRMNLSTSQVRVECQATYDLTLSGLYRWQAALNVPVTDILAEPAAALSPAVAWRGQLVKAMRTVRSIQLLVDDEAVQSLTIMLIQQLTEMMPELTHVAPWPTQGRQRTNDELGAIVDKQLPHDFFERPLGS